MNEQEKLVDAEKTTTCINALRQCNFLLTINDEIVFCHYKKLLVSSLIQFGSSGSDYDLATSSVLVSDMANIIMNYLRGDTEVLRCCYLYYIDHLKQTKRFLQPSIAKLNQKIIFYYLSFVIIMYGITLIVICVELSNFNANNFWPILNGYNKNNNMWYKQSQDTACVIAATIWLSHPFSKLFCVLILLCCVSDHMIQKDIPTTISICQTRIWQTNDIYDHNGKVSRVTLRDFYITGWMIFFIYIIIGLFCIWTYYMFMYIFVAIFGIFSLRCLKQRYCLLWVKIIKALKTDVIEHGKMTIQEWENYNNMGVIWDENNDGCSPIHIRLRRTFRVMCYAVFIVWICVILGHLLTQDIIIRSLFKRYAQRYPESVESEWYWDALVFPWTNLYTKDVCVNQNIFLFPQDVNVGSVLIWLTWWIV